MFGHSNAFPRAGKGDSITPIRRTALWIVALLVAVGAASAQQVQTDFDHQANFSQYKTYSWQAIKPANSLWDARIKSAVDAQLAAKGWTQVDSGADIAIVAIKTTQTQRTMTASVGAGAGEDSGPEASANLKPLSRTTRKKPWLLTCTMQKLSS